MAGAGEGDGDGPTSAVIPSGRHPRRRPASSIFRFMPLVTTSAVILHTFPYSETSKIVRLMTREHGVQSAIAKGAMRAKSKFGARLQALSEGTAQLYVKPSRDLHTLAEFDVAVQRPVFARHVGRYAAAVALAELVMRFTPAEPHPEIFDLVVHELDRLAGAPAERLPAASLVSLWAVIAALGFTPILTACARDGRALPPGTVAFSIPDGGFLCSGCARGQAAATLRGPHRRTLEQLVEGAENAVGPLQPRDAAAHRRLLVRFVERHVTEGREVRALSFWEGLS